MAYYYYKHSHSAYAPSSRADDISRLLDPAYSSSRLSPTSNVYVDHSGDFHDPDYRDFPVVNLTKKSRWEQDWHNINEQDEDEDQVPPKPLFYARRSSSRPRSFTSTPTTTSSTYSPYSHVVSPPTSLDDEDDMLSSVSSRFESDVDLGESKKRCRLSIDSKRRKSDSSATRSVPFAAPSPLSDIASAATGSVRNEDSREGLSVVKKSGEDQLTPTCSMAIRRQWQAIRLRLSLGVFRAKRRIRRKVGV